MGEEGRGGNIPTGAELLTEVHKRVNLGLWKGLVPMAMTRVSKFNPQGTTVHIHAVLPKAFARMPGPFFIRYELVNLATLINQIVGAHTGCRIRKPRQRLISRGHVRIVNNDGIKGQGAVVKMGGGGFMKVYHVLSFWSSSSLIKRAISRFFPLPLRPTRHARSRGKREREMSSKMTLAPKRR